MNVEKQQQAQYHYSGAPVGIPSSASAEASVDLTGRLHLDEALLLTAGSTSSSSSSSSSSSKSSSFMIAGPSDASTTTSIITTTSSSPGEASLHTLPEAAIQDALEFNALLLGEWHLLVSKYRRIPTNKVPAVDLSRMRILETTLNERVKFLATIADKSNQALKIGKKYLITQREFLRACIDPRLVNAETRAVVWGGEAEAEASRARMYSINPLPLSATVKVLQQQQDLQSGLTGEVGIEDGSGTGGTMENEGEEKGDIAEE